MKFRIDKLQLRFFVSNFIFKLLMVGQKTPLCKSGAKVDMDANPEDSNSEQRSGIAIQRANSLINNGPDNSIV